MAHIDPTISLDTVPTVTAAQLDAASEAHALIVVDGEFMRIPINTLLQANVYATTAQLAAVGSTVNTVGKYTGKQVYNTTTGILVLADGPAAADKWAESDGSDEHTPV
jgi:hypothetical protein